jgi:hypothetical protein
MGLHESWMIILRERDRSLFSITFKKRTETTPTAFRTMHSKRSSLDRAVDGM